MPFQNKTASPSSKQLFPWDVKSSIGSFLPSLSHSTHLFFHSSTMATTRTQNQQIQNVHSHNLPIQRVRVRAPACPHLQAQPTTWSCRNCQLRQFLPLLSPLCKKSVRRLLHLRRLPSTRDEEGEEMVAVLGVNLLVR